MKNIASSLEKNASEIMRSNAEDIEAATNSSDVDQNLVARLKLSSQKIANLSNGLRALSEMEEPIGKVLERTEIANGIALSKVTSPLGVLLIIFESRPDALVQICGLCIRTGNGLLCRSPQLFKLLTTALSYLMSPKFVTA